MPKFPIKEAEIVALAEQMVAGFAAHSADFPSVVSIQLVSALTGYKNQKLHHRKKIN